VSLTASAVRQWLRDHEGVAFCAQCIATSNRRAMGTLAIATEVDHLPRRSATFLPGRCRCGAVGVRYHRSSLSDNR
jgi:hypothetical protein